MCRKGELKGCWGVKGCVWAIKMLLPEFDRQDAGNRVVTGCDGTLLEGRMAIGGCSKVCRKGVLEGV